MTDELTPDRRDLGRFAAAIFKHASPDSFVLLRSSLDDNGTLFAEMVALGDPLFVEDLFHAAWRAANNPVPAIFCPPMVTYTATGELFEGLSISIDCDVAPCAGRRRLEAVLGAPTIVVASGGEWLNVETGEQEPRLHMHWRLARPVVTPEDHALLCDVRELATAVALGDNTHLTPASGLRWPGGWHRKDEPKLARIVFESENEINLGDVAGVLREAALAILSETLETIRDAANTAAPQDLGDVLSWVAPLALGIREQQTANEERPCTSSKA
jgi:hypothetical protein